MNKKLLVTPEDAAEMLSMSRTKIYEMLAVGDIISIKIGASRRIPVTAIDEFIKRMIEEIEWEDADA